MIDGCVFLRDDIGGNGPVCAYPWEKMLSECTYEEGYKTCPHLEFSLKKERGRFFDCDSFECMYEKECAYHKNNGFCDENCKRYYECIRYYECFFCMSEKPCYGGGRKMELEHETD